MSFMAIRVLGFPLVFGVYIVIEVFKGFRGCVVFWCLRILRVLIFKVL